MKTKPYLKPIKISSTIFKIKVNKNFVQNNKIKIKNPLSRKTKVQIEKFIDTNIETKNSIYSPQTVAEIVRTSKKTYEIFFSNQKIKNVNIKNENKTVIVAKFKRLKTLKLFCKNIYLTYKPTWSTSELYKFGKLSLMLIIHIDKEMEKEISPLLSEFNATVEKGHFQEAIVKEHCQVIFLSNAIEKISTIT